jgi:hypothetical protein
MGGDTEMINDDVLIKVVRRRGFSRTWPDQVNRMKSRLEWVRLGFPGISNDHLSIIRAENLKSRDLFIYDQHLEKGFGYGDEAPLMLRLLEDDTSCYVEGIGRGMDSLRDPSRLLIRWKDIIPCPKMKPGELVLKVNPNPSLNGGSAYYYFFKSYRDFRD